MTLSRDDSTSPNTDNKNLFSKDEQSSDVVISKEKAANRLKGTPTKNQLKFELQKLQELNIEFQDHVEYIAQECRAVAASLTSEDTRLKLLPAAWVSRFCGVAKLHDYTIDINLLPHNSEEHFYSDVKENEEMVSNNYDLYPCYKKTLGRITFVIHALELRTSLNDADDISPETFQSMIK